MTIAIVSALLVGQQLTSISGKIELSYPHGFLNSEGTHLFTYAQITRINLQTVQWKQDGWFKAAIHKGNPPVAVSRTMNQAHYDTENIFYGPHMLTDSWELREPEFVDAEGENRILAYEKARGGVRERSPEYVVMTEIKAEFRYGNPNHSWLLILPEQSNVRPVSARFVDDKTVELWVVLQSGPNCSFERYLGSREGTSQNLKRVERIPIKHFALSDHSILDNTWNPIERTFIGSNSSWEYILYDAQGKKLKSFEVLNTGKPFGTKDGVDTQAVWKLTIANNKVPGGKNSWIPFARSANSKIWLVKSKSKGDFKLLKL